MSANTATNEKPDQTAEQLPKVLIVDDSRLVRVSIKKLLGFHFDIIEAEDGEDGWLQIQKYTDLHVVMTDAGMPKLDGFGLIERVRASTNTRIANLPMIMITGAEESQTTVRERAFDLGASDFIIKPFDKTQLLARVKSYIRQDHLQRNLEMTEQTLKEHSNIDPLTKLPNHDYMIERFEQEMSLAKRHQHELSLIGLRVDAIPDIVRKFGDSTAQQIMVWLVEQLRPLIRNEDCLTRSGDYELCLIAPATDRMSAAYVCERLRSKVQDTHYDKTVISLPVTISIGLLNVSKDRPDSAEKALFDVRYRIETAQKMGGNRLLAQGAPSYAVEQTFPSPTQAMEEDKQADNAPAQIVEEVKKPLLTPAQVLEEARARAEAEARAEARAAAEAAALAKAEEAEKAQADAELEFDMLGETALDIDAEEEVLADDEPEMELDAELHALAEADKIVEAEKDAESEMDYKAKIAAEIEALAQNESEAEVEVDQDVNALAEVEPETEFEEDYKLEADANVDALTDVEYETGLEDQVETEAETEDDVDALAQSDSEAEFEQAEQIIETETEDELNLFANVEAETDNEVEAFADAENETDNEVEALADAENETDDELDTFVDAEAESAFKEETVEVEAEEVEEDGIPHQAYLLANAKVDMDFEEDERETEAEEAVEAGFPQQAYLLANAKVDIDFEEDERETEAEEAVEAGFPQQAYLLANAKVETEFEEDERETEAEIDALATDTNDSEVQASDESDTNIVEFAFDTDEPKISTSSEAHDTYSSVLAQLEQEERQTPELLSIEMLDMLKLGQSLIPVLKHINKTLDLDVNRHINEIEQRLRDIKQ